ncbi:hypothetical protein GCM10008994_20650 [Halorubrum ejinorense]|uniref:Secreted protein n=1 Tax=Halorubrum ejinorense TaxID=425309 RepID=A0AAV3STW0_9EURY
MTRQVVTSVVAAATGVASPTNPPVTTPKVTRTTTAARMTFVRLVPLLWSASRRVESDMAANSVSNYDW